MFFHRTFTESPLFRIEVLDIGFFLTIPLRRFVYTEEVQSCTVPGVSNRNPQKSVSKYVDEFKMAVRRQFLSRIYNTFLFFITAVIVFSSSSVPAIAPRSTRRSIIKIYSNLIYPSCVFRLHNTQLKYCYSHVYICIHCDANESFQKVTLCFIVTFFSTFLLPWYFYFALKFITHRR